MEYIVKCRFCGVTYFVNSSSSNARFSCETCGAINGMDDIVERCNTGFCKSCRMVH